MLPQSISTPLQQLASLCTFLVSCLVYRAAFEKPSSKLGAECRRDHTLPLMALLFRFGMAHYARISTSLRGPLLGDCTTLEDVFGRERKMPLSVCQDAFMVKAFLLLHYRGTPAEPLVRDECYHLLFGSRKGFAIRNDDWSKKGRIGCNTRVVMAVLVKTDDANCIGCRSPLATLGPGDLYW